MIKLVNGKGGIWTGVCLAPKTQTLLEDSYSPRPSDFSSYSWAEHFIQQWNTALIWKAKYPLKRQEFRLPNLINPGIIKKKFFFWQTIRKNILIILKCPNALQGTRRLGVGKDIPSLVAQTMPGSSWDGAFTTPQTYPCHPWMVLLLINHSLTNST